VLAASAQTHILCVHGDLVSWQKKNGAPMKKRKTVHVLAVFFQPLAFFF
jgi:hypothetical protein